MSELGRELAVPAAAVQVAVPLRLRRPLVDYLELFAGEPHAFLLESTLLDPRQGRFSFLAGRPIATLEARAPTGDEREHALTLRLGDRAAGDLGDPLAALRLWRARLRPSAVELPAEIPFLGGALGYLGYELLLPAEGVPLRAPAPDAPPDLSFAFVDEVLAVDHASDRAWLSVTGRAESEARAEWRAELRVFELMDRIRRVEAQPPRRRLVPPEGGALRFDSDLDRASYEAAVEAARAHIFAGDAFEVCLTRRLLSNVTALPAEAVYRALRVESPAPFAAYLRAPGVEIVSASPERFLRLRADGRVESRPIKGTRPRDDRPERDLALRTELATSPKDRAENLMIVDLVRNDLGRVAELGSVVASDLLRVEPYRTVYQLVSTVEAKLRSGLDLSDLVAAAFPGGSMTGAPKIEATKIIHRLERTRRGIYSGALGYLDHRGEADLAMVIRAAVKRSDRYELGVGGAVVSDSTPRGEWEESEHKAEALMRAFARAAAPDREVVGGER